MPCSYPRNTTMSSSLSIQIGQYSTAGKKPENQDFHGVLEPEGVDLAAKGIAVCIADGISTSKIGAEAAETAVKTFLTDYFCTSHAWSVRHSGERIIAATNSWMHAQNRRERISSESDSAREQGLICTFSSLVLKGRKGHVFHIGDAQVARVAQGRLEALTVPHRIDLGGGQSYLGRALGANPNVEIDYSQTDLARGDTFLLCTDGVYESLSDRVICERIELSDTLDQAAETICQAALDAGSDDNLTVQLVQVTDLPSAGLDDVLGQDTSLPPVPELRVGDTLDGYRILGQLHSGSRSHVYLARTDQNEERVALKVLSTELMESPLALQSLMLEEWIMRRFEHPNLLKAAPNAHPRNYAYSVSQYVEGESLHSWILDHKSPDIADVRSILKQLATGLEALHRREMVHRDVRPQNVMISDDGQVKIIDFGSVQVAGIDELTGQTLDGAHAGTIQYSAPELYLGYSASARSDQFSLGVIAYQMLTGVLPYGHHLPSANTRAAQRKLRYTPITAHNPDVPDWMDAAIAKAVSVDPALRYDEVWELVTDLHHPNPRLKPASPPALTHRRSLLFWQGLCALLAVGLAASLIFRL